jgi:hypothetical protein
VRVAAIFAVDTNAGCIRKELLVKRRRIVHDTGIAHRAATVMSLAE